MRIDREAELPDQTKRREPRRRTAYLKATFELAKFTGNEKMD